MSVEHLAVVLHHSRAKGTAKLVLLGIANHQGDGGAWPSVDTLARYANVTDRNVQKAIAALVSKGELAVAPQEGGTAATPDHRRPNRYEVLVSCPSWCDRSTNHRDTRSPARALFAQLSTGVSQSTPVPERRRHGVSGSTPLPPSHATPEPSPRTTTQSPGRKDSSTRVRCEECSAPSELVCWERQQRVAVADRHTYSPAVTHAAG